MEKKEIHPFIENDQYIPPLKTFEHKNFGPMGVGKSSIPIVGLDDLFDVSTFHELHLEACLGLAQCRDYGFGKVIGGYPPSLQKYDHFTYSDDILRQIEKFDPTGEHRKNLETIKDWDTRCRYICFALGAIVPWFFTIYLRDPVNFLKKGEQTEAAPSWTPQAEYFPKLKKFIVEKLPFKSIGRILFFTSFPNAGVPVHRDFNVAPHKDHNINFFFDGWRPSFIFNEKTNKKTYLEKGQQTYFFNNRDYHGVDPEPRFRYTLRVDGTFNDELQKNLSLEDGYVFNWHYKNANQLEP